MKIVCRIGTPLLAGVLGLFLWNITNTTANAQANLWLTNPEKSILFEKQTEVLTFSTATNAHPMIDVDDTRTFQSMEGFGWCLTGGSAQHLIRMDAGSRSALLKELFGRDGLGSAYLRVSLGASDLNERVFSYDDLPEGQIDPEMAQFNLGPDHADVIPVLKEIIAIQPTIKILASPWSPPTWMKTTNDTRGGSLKAECLPAYAKYFVKYIQAMKNEGIRIDAITIQNEPLHPGNNPSLLMLAPQQAEFIKNHLGPAFQAAKIDTKIIIYDHNADRPDYPITVLNDPDAKKFVDGSAFHFYAGKIEALSKVHEAHPDKHIYFTEQWVGAPGNMNRDIRSHVNNLIIGATRNWSRTVLEWNLSSDPNLEPHTDRGGCDRCLGAVTIDGNKVTRNPAYYIVAHASQFVHPGSVRIASNNLDNLPNVAFKTPNGQRVLIVLNTSRTPQDFDIRDHGKSVSSTLNAGAVGTYVWPGADVVK